MEEIVIHSEHRVRSASTQAFRLQFACALLGLGRREEEVRLRAGEESTERSPQRGEHHTNLVLARAFLREDQVGHSPTLRLLVGDLV